MVKESITKMLRLNNNENNQIQEIPTSNIKANPFQPRKHFDPLQLEELAKSIREYGVIQPLIVRKAKGYFELVAGERRLRAAQLIGLKTVPAIIRELDDKELAEIALVENLQREDLNYFEEAEGYKRLINDFALTQEEVAKRVGKSQSTIANKMRLLKLPDEVQKNINPEIVTERHARALLKIAQPEIQMAVLKEVYVNEYNVRETDLLVEKYLNPETEKKNKSGGRKIVRIFKDMRIYLNTIRNAVSTIAEAGLDIKMTEKEYTEYIELLIKIPKTNKQ